MKIAQVIYLINNVERSNCELYPNCEIMFIWAIMESHSMLYISMAWFMTAVIQVRFQWSYCNPAMDIFFL